MGNLDNIKEILNTYRNTSDRYRHILITLILWVLITGVFWFIWERYRRWIFFILLLFLLAFLFFFKNNKSNPTENTNDQLKKLQAFTELHKTIWDTDKTTKVFWAFFPDSWEWHKNWRLETTSNYTETDKTT